MPIGKRSSILSHGILLGLLEAEGDALFLLVDIEDDDFEFLADLEQFARVAEAAPGHVGDVEQAVHAIEVDERAEIGEVLDGAVDGAADLDAIEEFLALLGALLLDEFAAGEDDVFAVVVDLDDLEVVGVADELLEVLRGDDVDLGGREEGFDADIDGEAAFDDGFDLALDEAVALEDLDDLVPVLLVGGFFLGELDHALVVFEAFEEHFDFVADLEVFDVVEFRGGDDALRTCSRCPRGLRGGGFRGRGLLRCCPLGNRESSSRSTLAFQSLDVVTIQTTGCRFLWVPRARTERAYNRGKGLKGNRDGAENKAFRAISGGLPPISRSAWSKNPGTANLPIGSA